MINVATEFYPRLANRDSNQGDGKHTAIEFRETYLKSLDSPDFWMQPSTIVELDFSGIRKIGPSFANEAFAYFTKYAKPEQILQVILIVNASDVQRTIIEQELKVGYEHR